MRELARKQRVLKKEKEHEREDLINSANEGFKYIKHTYEDLKVTLVVINFSCTHRLLEEFELIDRTNKLIRLK